MPSTVDILTKISENNINTLHTIVIWWGWQKNVICILPKTVTTLHENTNIIKKIKHLIHSVITENSTGNKQMGTL